MARRRAEKVEAPPKRGRGRPAIGDRLELRLPADLRAALEAEAAEEEVPVAEVARWAIAARYS